MVHMHYLYIHICIHIETPLLRVTNDIKLAMDSKKHCIRKMIDSGTNGRNLLDGGPWYEQYTLD